MNVSQVEGMKQKQILGVKNDGKINLDKIKYMHISSLHLRNLHISRA